MPFVDRYTICPHCGATVWEPYTRNPCSTHWKGRCARPPTPTPKEKKPVPKDIHAIGRTDRPQDALALLQADLDDKDDPATAVLVFVVKKSGLIAEHLTGSLQERDVAWTGARLIRLATERVDGT
jgi:hypothetical protein